MQPFAQIAVPASAPASHPATGPLWPFVSQFLLGPSFADHLTGWQQLTLANQLRLSIHPALAYTQVRDGARELTLLGHILDPLQPTATNADILRALLAQPTRGALLNASGNYGGRWLLIGVDGNEAFLLPDALGLRQVFYTEPAEHGEVWAMSQPGIAMELLPLALDSQAQSYLDSDLFRCEREYRWPGAASPFKGVKHLLPNHWLDLASGECHRYWPSTAIEPLDADAAVDRLIVLMPGLLKAAAARHELALALTAGVDSRMALAAARAIVDDVRVVSVRQGRQPDGHPDIEIPRRLCARLGIEHEVIRAQATMSPEFALHYKRNAHLAHDHYGHDAEAILGHYGRTRAAITGSGAEITRLPFRDRLPRANHARLAPETLAWLEYSAVHPFLVAHCADWLHGARQPYVKLLDLFEWEQGATWLAAVQLEFDCAWRDVFTPFNCRAVLTTLLGVHERYRAQRQPAIARAFIERTWPALLEEPINPHKEAKPLAAAIQRAKSLRRYWLFHRRWCRRSASTT